MKGQNVVLVEQLNHAKEFEQILHYEVERKFMPLFPERLERYRAESEPIEQFYVSHPSEAFSLRFRESLKDGELQYEATLKDAGSVGGDGISRMEVTAPISQALYSYYKSEATPVIRKLRAEPRPGVVIDFYDDGSVQVESENSAEWEAFVEEHGEVFVEITGDRVSSNEWRAHLGFRMAHEGAEALTPEAELDPNSIVRDILERLAMGAPATIHIGGRSGSGKSTIVHEVQRLLSDYDLEANVMSTDNYHQGTTWLTSYNGGEPWTHWDEAIVYDTGEMANDLKQLAAGRAIYRREIDWNTVEPHFPGIIEPRKVLIIEGIYATSPDITNEDEPCYEMPTPLATCIGRRLLRDLKERPQFADPTESLKYMLQEAEPAYRTQLATRPEPEQNAS